METNSPTTGMVVPHIEDVDADIEELDTDPVGAGSEPTPHLDLSSLSEAIVDDQVGPFRLRRQIGEGGMGRVYLADEAATGRTVALKVLKFIDNDTLQRRFEREGDVLERLDHPNIVRLLARGSDPKLQLSYLAFEHVPGRDLGAIVRSLPGRQLSSPETVYVLERCARALSAAHELGILHRDIKLANVLVTPDAQVRLIDFGIALSHDVSVRLSARDEIMGTLTYIAPDVLRGQGWGPPADIYALGCLGFRLLVGQPPFMGKTPVDILKAHKLGAPNLAALRPEAHPGLCEVIHAMLSADPARRPTAEQLVFGFQRLGLASETAHVAREWSAGRLGLGFTSPDDTTLGAQPDRTEVMGRGTVLSASSEEVLAGRTIGPYQLVRPLGRGAMGEVYLVRHPELGTHYALKLLGEALVEDEEALARFEAEMANLAAVDAHPGIVRVHSSGTTPSGRPYFAMEFVEGQTLGRLLRRGLGPVRALDILEQVVEALAFAHERDLVHRDVKPDNVLVDDQGRARLTDFGLAKALSGRQQGLTRTGDTVGTPVYMSPEQGKSQLDRIGPWSDVFSLGAMIYEALTGKPPYHAETAVEVYAKLIEGEPIKPLRQVAESVSAELEAVVMRALALTPEERYADAGELLEALREARAAVDSEPEGRTLLYLGVGAAAALVLAFVAILFAKGEEPSAAQETAAAAPGAPVADRIAAAWEAGDVSRARALLARAAGPVPLAPAIHAAAGDPAAALAACGSDVSRDVRAMLAAWAGDAEGFEAALAGLDADHVLALRWTWAHYFDAQPPDAGDGALSGWRILARSEQALATGAPSLAEHLLGEAQRASGVSDKALAWARLRLELARGRSAGVKAAWRAVEAGAETALERLRVQAWRLLVRRAEGKPAGTAGTAAGLPAARFAAGADDEAARRFGRGAWIRCGARRAETLLALAERGHDRAAGALAARAWERALKLAPTPGAWVALARARLVAHDISGATEAAKRATAAAPGDAAALLVAARAQAAVLEASDANRELERARARNRARPEGERELADRWAAVCRAFEAAHAAGPGPETRLWFAHALTRRLDHLRAAKELGPIPVASAKVFALTEPLVQGVDAIVAARAALAQATLLADAEALSKAELRLLAAIGERPSLPLLRALYLRAICGTAESPAAASAYLAVAGDLPARALLALRRAEASKSLRRRQTILRHALKLAPRAAPLLLAVELAKLDQESVAPFARDAGSLRRLAEAIGDGPEWTVAVLGAVRANLPRTERRPALAAALSRPEDALARALFRVAAGDEPSLRRALLDAAQAERRRPTVAGELLRALALSRLGWKDRSAIQEALGAARGGAPHAAAVDQVKLHADRACDVAAVVDRLLAAGFLKDHEDLVVPPGFASPSDAPPDLRASVRSAIGPIKGVLSKFSTSNVGYSVGLLELLEEKGFHPRLAFALRLYALSRRALRGRSAEALRSALERIEPGHRDAVELAYRYMDGRLEESGSSKRRAREAEAAQVGVRALRTAFTAGGALQPTLLDVRLAGLGPDPDRTPGLPKAFLRGLPQHPRIGVYRQLRPRSAWVRYAVLRARNYAYPELESEAPELLSIEDLLQPYGCGRASLLGAQSGPTAELAMEWFVEEASFAEAPLALTRAAVFRRTASFSDNYEDQLEDYSDELRGLKPDEVRGQGRFLAASARAGLSWTRQEDLEGRLRGHLADGLLLRAAEADSKPERVRLATAALAEAEAAAALRDNRDDRWVRWRLARAEGALGRAERCARHLRRIEGRGRRRRSDWFARAVRADPLRPHLEQIPAYRKFLSRLTREDED